MFRLSKCNQSLTRSAFNQIPNHKILQCTTIRSLATENDENEDINNISSPPSFIKHPYQWIEHHHGAKAIRASSPEYNRWIQVIPPVTTMLCLGGMYSWSLFNGPLTHEIGVITSCSSDWTLPTVVPVFSTLVFMNGFAGFTLGKWIDRAGPRMAYALGGLCYGGGTCIGALGVGLHSLPLLYLGYGAIGGLGHGICYISCISTLIKFFPDRAGLASGMSLMGLGGGAILATPAIDKLLTYNFKSPQHIDDNILSASNITLNEKGQYFMNNTSEISKLDVSDLLSSGFSSKIMSSLHDGGTYLIGTGSTGAAATMFTVGSVYLGVSLTSSIFTKLPHPDFNPLPANTSNTNTTQKQKQYSMTVEEVFRTPQFWCMWAALFALSTTGMGCVSTAKTMMSEVFGGSLPLIVTASFASSYVMAISASNLSGRLGWGYVSDRIGPGNTYSLMGVTGCLLYASVPYYVSTVVDAPTALPLAMFYGSTLLVFSYFGGGFSVMPNYEAKLFGSQNLGAIHGRMMTAVALSGFVGPFIVTQCREITRKSSILDLSQKIDPMKFQETFGSTINELDSLIDSKAVTINKLMQLIPDNIDCVDPTPFLYDTTMYAMSGCMGVCAIANLLVKRFGTPTQMLQNINISNQNQSQKPDIPLKKEN